MKHWKLPIIFASLLSVTSAVSAAETITILEADLYGPHLADVGTRPYYLFTADQRAEGSKAAVSRCYDACAEAWPPLITSEPVKVQGNLDEGLLGSMKRTDGSVQVTFNGWPLYYYVKPTGGEPASAEDSELSGHGKREFGGTWYMVAPDGQPLSRN